MRDPIICKSCEAEMQPTHKDPDHFVCDEPGCDRRGIVCTDIYMGEGYTRAEHDEACEREGYARIEASR